MSVEQRLSEVLTEKLGYYVPIEEIGYETLAFMLDEIDEAIIKLEVINHLAEPIYVDSANYTDAEGNYYLLLSIETGLPDPYELWLVNDEIVRDFVDE